MILFTKAIEAKAQEQFHFGNDLEKQVVVAKFFNPTGAGTWYLVLATVVFTFTQRVDLVTDNYYEKELKFQEQIDRLERTKALPQKLILENNGKEIIIKFSVKPDPENKDTIIFYKPSDPSKDVRIPVNADSLGK